MEVKWIKIAPDIFKDEKMLAIESMKDGRDLQLIWFKILCLAGTVNQCGLLSINRKIACTDEMLSTIFHMDIGIVQRALAVFTELEMIEVVDDAYMVSNWALYQNEDGLEEIREKNRKRQQKFREKQKALIQESNVTVTSQNNVTSSISISDSNNINTIKSIINYLNEVCGTHYRYTDTNIRLIKARMNDGFVYEDFKTVIDVKYKDWHKDKAVRKFLRPQTLFGTKFESYLNQKEIDNDRGMERTSGANEITDEQLEIMRNGSTEDDELRNMWG